MTATFDTLAAARDLEEAGLEREAAAAIASAIRASQAAPSTPPAAPGDTAGLQWLARVNLAISLATLAGVLAMAFRP